MAGPNTRSRPSSRASTDHRGITLVELLVALVIAGIVVALILPLVMSNRRVVLHDQVRTASNQTLRSANDLLAADVRIAGERFGLGLGLSPLELRLDDEGNSELVLRRSLLAVLPVCEGLNGQQSSIKVADWRNGNGAGGGAGSSGGNPHCAVQRTILDDAGVEWPETLFEHKQAVEEAGGVLNAFIFDPRTERGQWFPMRVDRGPSGGGPGNRPDMVFCDASAGPGSCAWDASADYGPGDATSLGSFIGIIEESTYRVRDGVLEKLDRATGETLRIANGFDAFRVDFALEDGSTVDTFDRDDDWREVTSVDVELEVTLQEGRTELTRTLETSLFPRNLLSR